MLCLWPFRHVSVDQRGRIRPCCSWRFEEWEEHYSDSTIINFNNSTIQDYIDSQFLNTLQNNMITDKFPKGGCSDCFNEISNGVDSLAGEGFKKYALGKNFRLQDMEIKFGNKCNLGCVMCGPACSTFLENESINNFDFLESQGFEPTNKRIYNGIKPWFEREDKMKELAEFASNSQLIRFTGGEPTVNGYLRKFLSYLREYTTEIDLKLTTNGFRIPQSLLESVKDFRSVWFDFSIDGIGKVNEFVRWPSQWQSICDNIKRCNDLNNSKISVKTTLHALNLHDIGNICQWSSDNPDVSDWDVNLVWDPIFLRPCFASDSSKNIYIETCKKYQNSYDFCYNVISVKQAVLDTPFDPDQVDAHRKKLNKYLNTLTEIRKVDWKEYIKV